MVSPLFDAAVRANGMAVDAVEDAEKTDQGRTAFSCSGWRWRWAALAELQQTLSAAELVEWMAFYRIDPWGGYRADLGAAMVASTLANVHRAASSQPFTPDDFIPYARHLSRHPTMRKSAPHGGSVLT